MPIERRTADMQLILVQVKVTMKFTDLEQGAVEEFLISQSTISRSKPSNLCRNLREIPKPPGPVPSNTSHSVCAVQYKQLLRNNFVQKYNTQIQVGAVNYYVLLVVITVQSQSVSKGKKFPVIYEL